MIRNFGVKNYFCFKEGAEISFSLEGKAASHIGEEVSSVIGIIGANGSGKTNIIKAIGFLSLFVNYSAQAGKKRLVIPVISHFNNDDDTEFYIEFDVEGIVYFYELSLSSKEVKREAIYRKKERKTLILERVKNEVVECISSFNELKSIKLREDASIVSIFKNYIFNNEMEDLENVASALGKTFSNTNFSGYESLESNISLSDLSEQYLHDARAFEFVKEIIKKADDSIKDIVIQDRTNDEGEIEYYPVFLHSYEVDDEPVAFSFESSGTKKLYRTLSFYWIALMKGGLLCIDEFDIHLHAMILPDLLNIFMDKKINTKGAQFVFTAHNTEIIDALGKYRTVLVNKEGGESYCYRLDEIPGSMIRSDRAIMPLYLQGKIGGVPQKNV